MPNDQTHVTRIHVEKVDLVFTPATPIQTDTLFAGRASQVDKVYTTLLEAGRHAVLYGERGVGKTSLANIVSEKLAKNNAIVASLDISCAQSVGGDAYLIQRQARRRLPV